MYDITSKLSMDINNVVFPRVFVIDHAEIEISCKDICDRDKDYVDSENKTLYTLLFHRSTTQIAL